MSRTHGNFTERKTQEGLSKQEMIICNSITDL